jgi:hypothetical protein
MDLAYKITHLAFTDAYVWSFVLDATASIAIISWMKHNHTYDHDATMFVGLTVLPVINMLFALFLMISISAVVLYKAMDYSFDVFFKVCLTLHEEDS